MATPALPELIEREPALQALGTALAHAGTGVGCTALVCGEAGIGKTTLVARLAQQAPPGTRVLWGGCEALFSPRPLGPLYDMASGFSARLQAKLGQHGQPGQRAELFSGVLAELCAPAHGATLVVLEDLHWADAATLDLVKFMGRRLQRAPLLLVLTYRDDEVGERHPLRAVLGDLPADALVRVPLAPLTEGGVAELARRAQRPPEGLFALTGGNPFFLSEVVRDTGLPASVRDAVLARAARLAPPVRDLLDVAAIVPGRVESQVVDAVLAPRRDDVAAALSSGLLTTDGQHYSFRHELARLAIAHALNPVQAAALHQRVLACLEGAEGAVPATRLVHHARGAGNTAALLRHAPQAAAQAMAHGAYREAAALHATALARTGQMDPAARGQLLEQRAYCCYVTDQLEEAISARLSALAIWRSLGQRELEGRALRWLSRLHWFAGRNDDAQAYADSAVLLLGQFPRGVEYAWALSNRAQLHMLADNTAAAVQWGQRAIALATELGDDEVLAHALNNVGAARLEAGQEEGWQALRRSLQLALAHNHAEHAARAYVNLVSGSVKGRHYARGLQVVQEATAYFAERDLDSWGNYLRAWAARLHFEQGRWDQAADCAFAVVRHPGVAAVSRIPALAVLGHIRLRRGDPGAEALLQEAGELARQTGEAQRLAPVAAALAEAAWLRGGLPPPHPLVMQVCRLARQSAFPRALGELGYWCRQLAWPLQEADVVEAPYGLQFAGRWREAAAA